MGGLIKKITLYNYLEFWKLYCTQYDVLHTIWCSAHYVGYCILLSILYNAHCNIPVNLNPRKNNSILLQPLSANKICLVVTELYSVCCTD